MALTGLAIVGFLFGHALGNLQFLLGADIYNTYAAFLQQPFGLGEILWAIRIVLALCLILHIISAVYLRLKNNAAKPTHYRVKNYVKSKLTARTMLWTGILICTGVTLHLLHFTTGTIQRNDGYNNYEIISTGHYAVNSNDCADYSMLKNCGPMADCESECPTVAATVAQTECTDECPPGDEMCGDCAANPTQCSKFKPTETYCAASVCTPTVDDCPLDKYCGKVRLADCNDCNLTPVIKERHNVHQMVTAEFSSVLVSLLYLLFVTLVGFHLNHAIQSAVHTLGIEGPKFTPCMRLGSIGLSIILVLLFSVLPLTVVLNSLLGIDIVNFIQCIMGGC
jgi:succinate dehydrogenase/fumarate reductase cytochrome b subunit